MECKHFSGSRPIIVLAFVKGLPLCRTRKSVHSSGCNHRKMAQGTGHPIPGQRGHRRRPAIIGCRVEEFDQGACRRQQAPVGGRPMTDDQLILLAVLPIFRAPTEGDRAPSSRTDRPGRGRWNSRDGVFFVGIMLGGGAALIPTRRWFVVLSLTF